MPRHRPALLATPATIASAGPFWHCQDPAPIPGRREDGSDLRVEAEVLQPSGLGWLSDGRLLIVSMRDARVLRVDPDGTVTKAADDIAMAANFVDQGALCGRRNHI
jgi:hypothetical protein